MLPHKFNYLQVFYDEWKEKCNGLKGVITQMKFSSTENKHINDRVHKQEHINVLLTLFRKRAKYIT